MRQRKDIDTAKLVAEYSAGKSIADLTIIFDVSAPVIYQRLKESGCQLKTTKIREGEVGCPCFRAVVFNSVTCEAGKDWNYLSLNFGDKEKGKLYRKRFCLSENYTNCPIFKNLEVNEWLTGI